MKKTGKMILALLLCAAMLLGLSAAVFADGTVVASGNCGADGDNVKWTLYGDGRLVISGTGAMKEFSCLNDVPWYNSRSSVKSAEIGSGVTSIGKHAFYDCRALTSLTIPAGVKTIGECAFLACCSLTSVTIPSSVTSIGSGSFATCGFKNITIPSSVKTIGECAFCSCWSLTSVCFSGSAPTISCDAFRYVTATAYYPADDPSWTSDILQNYDGTLTWVAASKPTITTQPKDAAVALNKTATFNVIADGDGLRYQWYYRTSSSDSWKQVKMASGQTATYKLLARERHDGYQYRCKVSCGSKYVYSRIATLSVSTEKPAITTQPEDVLANAGESVSFFVTAKGNGLSYQWYVLKTAGGEWTPVADRSGKTATYTLAAAKAKHSGYQYKCVVTNPLGEVTSNTVKLTVFTAPQIIEYSTENSVRLGSSASFEVLAKGVDLKYQWYVRKSAGGSWMPVADKSGKTATYTLAVVKEKHDGYQYKCVVSNSFGSVESEIATLSIIKSAPLIQEGPADMTVSAGETAVFAVNVYEAADSEELGFQWYYQKPGSDTWIKVKLNGTSSAYSLTARARHNGYKYKCVVSTSFGSAESGVATLTVK